MVSVVSSSPTGGNFIFLRHLDANFVQKWQKCQICVIYENLEYQTELQSYNLSQTEKLTVVLNMSMLCYLRKLQSEINKINEVCNFEM